MMLRVGQVAQQVAMNSGTVSVAKIFSVSCRRSIYNKQFEVPARCVSVSSVDRSAEKLKIQSSPPEKVTCDWIGPPDPDSNLRLIRFHVPSNESKAAAQLRKKGEEAQKFNQEYWASHNRSFSKSKDAFIKGNLKEHGTTLEDGTERRLTSAELSQFYRQFLNENYEAHKLYNKEWYKRNFAMLWPAFKVFIEKHIYRR